MMNIRASLPIWPLQFSFSYPFIMGKTTTTRRIQSFIFLIETLYFLPKESFLASASLITVIQYILAIYSKALMHLTSICKFAKYPLDCKEVF